MKQAISQLRFEHWPQSDQNVWNDLFVEGSILDDAGPARHWAPATRKTNQKHYAQWLGWLARNDELDEYVNPWSRATADKVRAYARNLMKGRAPCTVASCLIGLKCVLVKMAPGQDWQWLRDLTNRLQAWAKPSRPKPHSPIPLPDLFKRCLSTLDEFASTPLNKTQQRQLYRDVLIIAFLIACPVRLRNLAMTEIGNHLTMASNGEWHLHFSAEETKTGEDTQHILPQILNNHIHTYIDKVRPAFSGATQTNRLWMGSKKAPLAENTLYQNTMRRTKELFGTGINPHAFRSLDATFLAENSPADALRARPLLGHRRGQTTEKYYIQACQIEASRNISNALQKLKGTAASISDTLPRQQTKEA